MVLWCSSQYLFCRVSPYPGCRRRHRRGPRRGSRRRPCTSPCACRWCRSTCPSPRRASPAPYRALAERFKWMGMGHKGGLVSSLGWALDYRAGMAKSCTRGRPGGCASRNPGPGHRRGARRLQGGFRERRQRPRRWLRRRRYATRASARGWALLLLWAWIGREAQLRAGGACWRAGASAHHCTVGAFHRIRPSERCAWCGASLCEV